MNRLRSTLLLALGLSSPLGAQDAVLSATEHAIGEGQGGLVGSLLEGTQFGTSLCALGDVDSDGVPDLAVGARNSQAGAVIILFMQADGTVRDQVVIDGRTPLLAGKLSREDRFGYDSITALGDQDGNGVPDIAVGVSGEDDGGFGRGGVWFLGLEADASLTFVRKISATEGGFPGTLSNRDLLGEGLALLGDIDGNGSLELAVGAPGDDDAGLDAGAIWILSADLSSVPTLLNKISGDGGTGFGTRIYNLGDIGGDGVPDLFVRYGDKNVGKCEVVHLNTDGTVSARTPIASPFHAEAEFGSGVAPIGDIDGDGLSELAIGTPRYPFDPTFTITPKGRVDVHYLDADGVSHDSTTLAPGRNGVNVLPQGFGRYGESLATIDFDGDGVFELVTGMPGADSNKGRIWVMTLSRCDRGRVEIRNGAGVNAIRLTGDPDIGPGADYTFRIDTQGHAPGLAIVAGISPAIDGLMTRYGEALIDWSGRVDLLLLASHNQEPALELGSQLPNDIGICGLSVSFQGVVFGDPGPELTNAIDLTVGP